MVLSTYKKARSERKFHNSASERDNVVFIFSTIVMEQNDISDEELMNNEVPQQEAVVGEAAIPGQPEYSVDSEEEYFLRLCLQPWEDEAMENQTGKFWIFWYKLRFIHKF